MCKKKNFWLTKKKRQKSRCTPLFWRFLVIFEPGTRKNFFCFAMLASPVLCGSYREKNTKNRQPLWKWQPIKWRWLELKNEKNAVGNRP